MKKRLLQYLQYFIFLGGGLALVWWQLSSMKPDEKTEFYEAIHHVRYWVIGPVVVLALLSHLARSLRWRLLMEPLQYRPGLLNTFCVTMVGYLANSAVPRLGEVLKCTLLARYENLKTEKLIGTILVERAFDVFCYLLFIGFTILIQIDVISKYARENINRAVASPALPVWAKISIVAGGIIFLVILFRWLFRKYSHIRFVERIRHFFMGLNEGLSVIRHLKKKKLFLAYTLLIWTCYLFQIYLGFFAMAATAHLSLKAACSVLTLATLAMIATPGGIGSFPLGVMQTLRVYAIPRTLGKAFGWVMWGVSTGIIIVVGIICLLMLPAINKKKNEISPVNPL